MGAFSVGFPYNYWSKFKWDWYRYTDKSDEYYIEPKYRNFKEEILEYKDLSKKQYENEVITKANIYIETKAVKGIPATEYKSDGLKYNIAAGTEISINHLISVILYTDYTNLSSQFTSTFRQNGLFEPMNVTKERNRKYAYWSKLLLETVQVYGDTGEFWDGGMLCGPFYCGMSTVMRMPQFQILLQSPTSTSLHVEVAMKFSGEEGIIIEFNNSNVMSRQTKGFDVSYISRYKEEEER